MASTGKVVYPCMRRILSDAYVRREIKDALCRNNLIPAAVFIRSQQMRPFERQMHHYTNNSTLSLPRKRQFLKPPESSRDNWYYNCRRQFSAFAILRNVLKIRYLILGGAAGGGYAGYKKLEELKSRFPDYRDYFPSSETLDAAEQFWTSVSEKFSNIKLFPGGDPNGSVFGRDNNSDIDGFVSGVGSFFGDAFSSVRDAFGAYNDYTMPAAAYSNNARGLSVSNSAASTSIPPPFPDPSSSSYSSPFATSTSPMLSPSEREELRRKVQQQQSQNAEDSKTNKALQDELMHTQLKWQKQVEKLEKDNRELRKALLLQRQGKESRVRKLHRSAIDMYSEVLDELSSFEAAQFNLNDQLPRVVVIGDQSSGKTSVLEMIAQARIFPRGSGEMMTRAPVQVTLSEGPYHVAQFRGSPREFDLTNDAELAELRREVELRMRNSIREGATVSTEVISMSVKGPGLNRMVLVDLPGIIATQTIGMADNTRESILSLSRHYMLNPNAIILCIQDGSIDAERSNVTDLVSTIDPDGKRTIFVLTKVDLAELNATNPERIKRILEGTLFPMKALGYFAVVTGRGNTSESISAIQQYEEEYFRSSRLGREGVFKANQMTTRNLSHAVSDRFWSMVRDSIDQQASNFKAMRYNLETEWKNNYPKLRILDRDELYDKARGEILDEVINLSQVPSAEWEKALEEKLWQHMADFLFDTIYIPASESQTSGAFRTLVDIRLNQWTESALPEACVRVGRETLREKFTKLIDRDKGSKQHDAVFDSLKGAVITEVMNRHHWEKRANDMLRVIQQSAIEDHHVHNRRGWEEAATFLQQTTQERLNTTDQKIRQLVGPSWSESWMKWKSSSEDQRARRGVMRELTKLYPNMSSPANKLMPAPTLSEEDVTTVRKNLESTQSISVAGEFIRETWHFFHRLSFLTRAVQKAEVCKREYFHYSHGLESELDCSDVVLFWRIKRMISATSNALRQQITNTEVQRLESEIKDVLDEFGGDDEKLRTYLTGRRVELAEQLRKVRHIQERLDDFMRVLEKEKS